MKDLIGVAILIATLFGGSTAVKLIHGEVRKSALEKANHGLPNLLRFQKSLK